MATEGMTITGLDQLRAGAQQLPTAIAAASRAVALATAVRVHARARAILGAPNPPVKAPPSTASSIAEAIVVEEDVPNQRVLVISKAPQGKPANLPLWYAYGTVRQPARPYMEPALKAETPQYIKDLEAAALEPVRALLAR